VDKQEPSPGSRFTDNSAGTQMDPSPEAVLATEGMLDRPEAEQRAHVLARHAERPYGRLVAGALRQAGWLPPEGGEAHVANH
jgi:hypothetical protein